MCVTTKPTADTPLRHWGWEVVWFYPCLPHPSPIYWLTLLELLWPAVSCWESRWPPWGSQRISSLLWPEHWGIINTKAPQEERCQYCFCKNIPDHSSHPRNNASSPCSRWDVTASLQFFKSEEKGFPLRWQVPFYLKMPHFNSWWSKF